MMKVQRDKVRLRKLTDEDSGYVEASPAERLAMIWELTAEIWSLRGQDCAQQRLQRHVASLVKQRQIVEIEGLSIPILSLGDLIKNKRATGRDKDRLDADNLENGRS